MVGVGPGDPELITVAALLWDLCVIPVVLAWAVGSWSWAALGGMSVIRALFCRIILLRFGVVPFRFHFRENRTVIISIIVEFLASP